MKKEVIEKAANVKEIMFPVNGLYQPYDEGTVWYSDSYGESIDKGYNLHVYISGKGLKLVASVVSRLNLGY